jgi:hypothetical protein
MDWRKQAERWLFRALCQAFFNGNAGKAAALVCFVPS